MNLEQLLGVAAGLLGLAVGSFLNVVVYRLPRRQSLLFPPSRCPSCERPIRKRHNVPVMGWLVLRGRCADCSEPISARYPLVEAGTGVVFGTVAVATGLTPYLPAALCTSAVGICMALIARDAVPLPRVLLVLGCVGMLSVLVTQPLRAPDSAALEWAAAGLAAMIVGYCLRALLTRRPVAAATLTLVALTGAAAGSLSVAALAVASALVAAFGVIAMPPERSRPSQPC